MGAYETCGKSDDWYTPKYIFDALNIQFDLDVASPAEGPRYVPAVDFYTKQDNGLAQRWYGTVWMNPPFGHQSTKRKWLTKFFEHGDGIALMPDRTSAPWWQEFAPKSEAILFVSPKVKFERPDGSLGEQPGSGTVLMALGQEATDALHSAACLGVLLEPSKKGGQS
ncbi:DNA N-6-adenine-methyltransferase [Cohaesibacter gelatinilyticus]|uniref:Phage N-6-adenine-methyltransferase n=1 Tax=Cohaesibacter gelatinilyticus TaxID=372072 RepID=A0A285PIY2_9HYPH|nr:DNA N-6-adenine-methyltransferase [Cohaesibacter gelatinilyticus]SNZ21675.1 phage N-6-adenine-methyltransferase [Cohaesibacter gelatinilyticus]